jgi:hypothetical protein
MRNEMIGAVVRRAIEHPEFRRRLVEDPREALTTHGFALEDAELAEIDKILVEHGKEPYSQKAPKLTHEGQLTPGRSVPAGQRT